MVYLAVRPKASAVRNFAVGYWRAPATNKNGVMGTGGGSIAGMAMAKNPQRSKGFGRISELCDVETFSRSLPFRRCGRCDR